MGDMGESVICSREMTGIFEVERGQRQLNSSANSVFQKDVIHLKGWRYIHISENR